MSVSWSGVSTPNMLTVGPIGMTAKMSSDANTVMSGARM